MPATIADMTFVTTERGVEVNQSQIVRKYKAGPWNALRIAARLSYFDSGSTPAPGSCLTFGLVSGAVNLPGSATCDHFLGFRSVDTAGIRNLTWTRTVSAGSHRVISAAGQLVTKIVDNSPFLPGSSFTPYIFTGDGASAFRQSTLIIEYLRTSATTMTMRAWASAATVFTPSSRANWIAALDSSSPTAALVTNEAAASSTYTLIPVAEGIDGALDHVVLGWDKASPTLFVNEFHVVKVT